MKSSGPPRRLRGTLKMWDDDKGFGFITSEEGEADVFLHISAFGNNIIRPASGAKISYCLTEDEAGRPRAVFARVESMARLAGPAFRPRSAPLVPLASPQRPPKPARRIAPDRRRQRPRGVPFVVWPLFVSAGFVAALAGAAHFQRLEWWVPAIYGAASSVTFIVYAWDKVRAVEGEWRVPENTLHLLEAIGGWPGALLAQQWLRHKTAKGFYQVIFWLIVTAHIGAWVWWTLERGKGDRT